MKHLKDMPILPGEVFKYKWTVTVEDGPTKSDPRCLTRYYSSFINLERDLASGLIGPLLICYKESVDQRGNQMMSDKRNVILFSVFDENQSWYLTENMQRFLPDADVVQPHDPEFQVSNIMHSINGYVFDNLQLSVCLHEVAYWYILSLWVLGCHNSDFRNKGMTALLKVSSCNRNIGDYYEDTYEDVPISLLNENNVIAPRSFSQKSRHPSTKQKQFKATTTPENDIEKIDPQSAERTPLLKAQSVSSRDLLMLLGQNPTPHGLFLSDLQEATHEADGHLLGAIEGNKAPSEVASLRPELHHSGDRVFTPKPELQLRLNENLGTTVTVELNKPDLKISSSSDSLMTSPTIPSDKLAASPEKTDSLEPPNMSVHFNSHLGTIVFGKNSSHLIQSGVPLGLSEGNNDFKLLEAALMNSQESSLGENILSMESNRLFKEERVRGPASLIKDNALFKVNISLVKTNKTSINSTINRKTHVDVPTLFIENSTSVWQDTILESNTELQEVTSLIHNETFMDRNITALGLNHVSNKTTSSKNVEMAHQRKEGPVPLGTENPDLSFFKIPFLPDSANWLKRTHGKNSLSSEQRPSPKQLTSLGSEKSVKDKNFLSEEKVVIGEDEFTKDIGLKEIIFPKSKSIFFTNLANVQENDTYNQEKKSQEEIERKEKLTQENMVLPQVYTVIGTKNFLKNLFLLSTKQNVEGLDEQPYTPILQDTRSLNDSAHREGIHMANFSKIREEANLGGLGNQTKQMVERFPSITRMSPNPSQHLITQRGKRALKEPRLSLEEIKFERWVILNDTSTQWSKNMNHLTQGTLTKIEYNEKEKRAITQSLLSDCSMRIHGLIQMNDSALPIAKVSAFPSIRHTDLTKIPSQDNSSHLPASACNYTSRERSSRVQERSHFLQEAKRNNLSLAFLTLEMIGGQGKFSSMGKSATNQPPYKKLENTLLLKPGLSKTSGKVELLPKVHVHQDSLPTKASNDSPGHLDLMEKIFLQKTQGPVKLNKTNRPGKVPFLKWATESSEKIPSKLLGPLAWDNHSATQIPREEWKSQKKSQKNTAFKRKDTILPLGPCENNHSITAINEEQDKPQREATWAKQGGTGRLCSQNPPVSKRHQREITLSTLQPEEDKFEYDDTFSIEMKREDFDIYGEDENQGLRSFQQRTRHYFIAAVERLWDYG
ncbi:hypothetical protein GH733_019541 [Mirounga leonina]|nr:hypothetical protein GH733_019541 [Mirounga leonina]